MVSVMTEPCEGAVVIRRSSFEVESHEERNVISRLQHRQLLGLRVAIKILNCGKLDLQSLGATFAVLNSVGWKSFERTWYSSNGVL